MNINTIIDRKHEIRTLANPSQFVKQRIAKAAEELSRAGDMAAHVELANEALSKYTLMLYATDSDGVLANVDGRTGKIYVAAPWGNKGWKRWGLRCWEAVTLRGVLMARIVKPRHVSLYDYNTATRKWHINTNNYPTVDRAQAYLQHCAVTLAEWRACYVGSTQGSALSSD